MPTWVDDLIAAATTKDIDRRVADAGQFIHRLRARDNLDALDDGRSASVLPERPQPLTEASAINPYKGLRAFSEADADEFYGRDQLVESLLSHFGGNGNARLLTIVGPSGSGKSSIVRAGLLPAIRKGGIPGSAEWFVTTMVPGAAPFEELEAALLRVAVNPPEQLLGQLTDADSGMTRAIQRILPDEQTQLLLVVDQFEELFVLAPDDVRRHFLEALAPHPRRSPIAVASGGHPAGRLL